MAEDFEQRITADLGQENIRPDTHGTGTSVPSNATSQMSSPPATRRTRNASQKTAVAAAVSGQRYMGRLADRILLRHVPWSSRGGRSNHPLAAASAVRTDRRKPFSDASTYHRLRKPHTAARQSRSEFVLPRLLRKVSRATAHEERAVRIGSNGANALLGPHCCRHRAGCCPLPDSADERECNSV